MTDPRSSATEVLTRSEIADASDAVRKELEAALASRAFGQSESLKRFLRHVVEATLEGRDAELKEIVLGTEVFARGDDFDPRVDPIVRVQATRLRAKLREFYEDRPPPEVRIVLPKGTYVPSFRRPSPEAPADAAPADAPAEAASTPHVSGVGAGLALLAAVVVALAAWWATTGGGAPTEEGEIRTMLVLPFSDMSPSGDYAYYGDGLADEITTTLAGVDGLAVTPRTTAFALRERPLEEIASAAAVDAVLQGSVRHSERTLRISAQLLRTRDGAQLWAETYDGPDGDAFRVQEDIARQVAGAVRKELGARVAEAPEQGAFASYLRGRFDLARTTPVSIGRAIESFEKATELDPDYGPAYVGLVQALVVDVLWGFAAPADTRARAREAKEQALSLAAGQPDALAAASAYELIYEWDRDEAESLLEQAERAATERGGEVDTMRGLLLTARRRLDEAVTALEPGASATPPVPFRQYLLGTVLLYAGRLEEADAWRSRLRASAPDYALGYWLEASIARDSGDFSAAHRALDTFEQVSGETLAGTAARGVLLAREGRRDEASTILAELRSRDDLHVPPELSARVLAALGETDEAFAVLERARDRDSLPMLVVACDPVFEPLRNDPRYPALVTLRTESSR